MMPINEVSFLIRLLNNFRLISDTRPPIFKQPFSLPLTHTHRHTHKYREDEVCQSQLKKKEALMTDDSLFAFAPHNICNLETLRSLSPSSFEEGALTADINAVGNVDEHRNKCLKM